MTRVFDYQYLEQLALQSVQNQTDTGLFIPTPFPIPPSILNVIGVLLILIMVILSNAGGLGGGGNLTPFIMIFFNLSLIECIPIGNFLGFISAMCRFVINFRQKHPNNPRRLAIDYEIIELSMPLLYLGTLFGVQIGTRLTEIQLAIVFAIVLFFVAFKTAEKAYKMIREENKKALALNQNHLSYIDNQQLKTRLLSEDQDLMLKNHQKMIQLQNGLIEQSSQLQSIMREESQHFTVKRCFNFIITLGFLIITSMLLNSKDRFAVNIYYQYLAVGLFIIYSLVSTYYISKNLQRNYYIKLIEGYHFDKHDITYESTKPIIKVILLCHISGILGGIVGIAGGIILGPLFLQLGMLPVLVASTNQYLALISTIAVSFQYWYLGMLNLQYIIVLGSVTVLGCYIGIKQVQVIVQKSGRQSIMVVILAIVLFLSFSMIPVKYWLKSLE
ncbi:UNKNOWN [Stylonychia lemnae]|uniref:Uncharacterized protein n=1 Tax=Stylonychia lemnae TaxID=5949 RepID=A0A077ZRR0_STYLE|nr:UNKNOWN [Stylonychia lemnae]|eukprot:CDW72608.1 UNKNOWN [Stylonychia lemnae]